MTRKNLFTSAVVIFSLLFFSSCVDNQVSDASEEAILSRVQSEINSTSLAEVAIENAEASIAEFLSNSSSSSNVNRVLKMVAMPEITLITEENTFPRLYKINFGEKFVDIHENIFSGVIYKIQSSYKENEFVFGNLIAKYEIYEKYKDKLSQKGDYEFRINDKLVEGYKKVDALEEGVLKFKSEIITDKYSKQEKSRYSETQRLLIDDNKTKDIYTDDSFKFTGFSKGNIFVDEKEMNYTYEIIKPLETVSNYKYFVRGITLITIGESTQSRDYGDGEIDNIALQTTNDGKPKKIELNWGK